MQKNRKDKSYIHTLNEGQKETIQDFKHGSKAIVPIQIDPGNFVEIVEIDGGLITGLSEGQVVADNLVYTIKDAVGGLNITWIIELKGTKNKKEADHSIKQILNSIKYMQDEYAYPQASEYIKKRDYVFAAVAGAPDRTLPVFNNNDLRELCRKLQKACGKKKNIKNMFSLFCYIRPVKRSGKARIKGEAPPYDIICYNNSDGFVPYPSMLLKMLEN